VNTNDEQFHGIDHLFICLLSCRFGHSRKFNISVTCITAIITSYDLYLAGFFNMLSTHIEGPKHKLLTMILLYIYINYGAAINVYRCVKSDQRLGHAMFILGFLLWRGIRILGGLTTISL